MRIRNIVETIRAAAWASRQGWERDRGNRCPQCGSQVYRNGGDWACIPELILRYRKRSDVPA